MLQKCVSLGRVDKNPLNRRSDGQDYILNKKPPPSTVPPPEELVSMFFKWADPSNMYQGFACLPYISGLTEPLTRLLRKNDIRVVNKPLKTLQQEFPSPKFRQPSDVMLLTKFHGIT